MKHWAMNYDKCQECHSTNKPHHGGGLCTTCYHRQYQRENPGKRSDNLERFIQDLPSLMRQVGILGYSASYHEGAVIIHRPGNKKLKATWKPHD